MENETNHFHHGTRVWVLFCDLSNSWLVGRVVGTLDSGSVHVELTGGLRVTRSPERVKHVDSCGYCCT